MCVTGFMRQSKYILTNASETTKAGIAPAFA
jgi:hypothetical protein